MKNKIEVGSLVIINTMDRPCSRLVMKVEAIEGERVDAVYLSENTTIVRCSGHMPTVTNIRDFGAVLHYSDDEQSFHCNTCDSSVAKYADGSVRFWQESAGDGVQPLRKI